MCPVDMQSKQSLISVLAISAIAISVTFCEVFLLIWAVSSYRIGFSLTRKQEVKMAHDLIKSFLVFSPFVFAEFILWIIPVFSILWLPHRKSAARGGCGPSGSRRRRRRF
jgi:hypothetical protein